MNLFEHIRNYIHKEATTMYGDYLLEGKGRATEQCLERICTHEELAVYKAYSAGDKQRIISENSIGPVDDKALFINKTGADYVSGIGAVKQIC